MIFNKLERILEDPSTSIDISVNIEEVVTEAVEEAEAKVEEVAEVKEEIVEETAEMENLRIKKSELEFVDKVISTYGVNEQFMGIMQFMGITSLVNKASNYGLESNASISANLSSSIKSYLPKFDILIGRQQVKLDNLEEILKRKQQVVLSANVDDKSFGKLSHNHTWKKEDTLSMWGKEYSVTISVAGSNTEKPNKAQQDSYTKVKDTLAEVIGSSTSNLIKYCKDEFGASGLTDKTIANKLTPRTVLFQKDGSWGILFDCEYEEEHGICLYSENGSMKIGSQDDFL